MYLKPLICQHICVNTRITRNDKLPLLIADNNRTLDVFPCHCGAGVLLKKQLLRSVSRSATIVGYCLK